MEAFAKPQEPGGFETPKRSSCGKRVVIVSVVLVVLALLCAGICGGIFYAVFRALKTSEPYQMALKQVEQDPQVIKRLGKPIEDVTTFPTGSISVENDSGEATLEFDVAGPDGEAHVHTQARKVSGKWGLTVLEVTFHDGEKLSVDTGSGKGPDDAPPWPPRDKDPDPDGKPAPDSEDPPDVNLPPPGGLEIDVPEAPGQ